MDDDELGDLVRQPRALPPLQQPPRGFPSPSPSVGLPPPQVTPPWYTRMTDEQQFRVMPDTTAQLGDIAKRTPQMYGDYINESLERMGYTIYTAMNDPDPEKRATAGARLAGWGLGIGVPYAAESETMKGAAGIFGGKMIFGKDAQALSDLAKAHEMEEASKAKGNIRLATQWHQDPMGGWNREISDYGSSLNLKKIPRKGAGIFSSTLSAGEVLNHPEFYKIHPEAQNIPVSFEAHPDRSATGWYEEPSFFFPHGTIVVNTHTARNNLEIKNTILHELSHYADKVEGFDIPPQTGLPFEDYRRLINEVKARNVEYRQRLPPEFARVRHPWDTQSVPTQYQITTTSRPPPPPPSQTAPPGVPPVIPIKYKGDITP